MLFSVSNFTAFNSTSLHGKLITLDDCSEPIDIKYLVIFRKYEVRQCTGFLLSPRLILSTAGCMNELKKRTDGFPKLHGVTVTIDTMGYNLKDAVYDDGYTPSKAYSCRSHDVGMALVCLLINFYWVIKYQVGSFLRMNFDIYYL